EGDPLPPCRTRCGATSLLLRVLAGCAAIACRAAGEQHRPDAGEQHRPDAAGAAPEVMGLDTTQAGTDTPPRKSAAGDRSSLTVVIDNARLLVVDPRGRAPGWVRRQAGKARRSLGRSCSGIVSTTPSPEKS